jgi:hypothetical protein
MSNVVNTHRIMRYILGTTRLDKWPMYLAIIASIILSLGWLQQRPCRHQIAGYRGGRCAPVRARRACAERVGPRSFAIKKFLFKRLPFTPRGRSAIEPFIQAQRSRSSCRDVEKYKAVRNDDLASVQKWPESKARMNHEIGNCHFSRHQ